MSAIALENRPFKTIHTHLPSTEFTQPMEKPIHHVLVGCSQEDLYSYMITVIWVNLEMRSQSPLSLTTRSPHMHLREPSSFPWKWAISLHCYIPSSLNCLCNLMGTQLKFVKWLKEWKASSSLLLLGNFLLGQNVLQRPFLPNQFPQCIPRFILFWSDELWIIGKLKPSLDPAWMGSGKGTDPIFGL